MTIKSIIYDPCDVLNVWYVVFCGEGMQVRPSLMPWYARPFVSEGFRHVYAMRAASDDGRETVLIEHIAEGLVVNLIHRPPENLAVFEYENGRKVVQIATKLKPSYNQRIMSCVGVTKALLGIEAWHVWTPRQLYNHLIKLGGMDLCEAAEICSKA